MVLQPSAASEQSQTKERFLDEPICYDIYDWSTSTATEFNKNHLESQNTRDDKGQSTI